MDERTLDILGYAWELRFRSGKKVAKRGRRLLGGEGHYHGLCVTGERTIWVSRDHPTPGSIALHEIIHAVSDEMGAGLTESQAQALETGLHYVFTKNRWLAPLIFGGNNL